jgi:hypothetical protein
MLKKEAVFLVEAQNLLGGDLCQDYLLFLIKEFFNLIVGQLGHAFMGVKRS